MSSPRSRFPVPPVDELPEDIRLRMEELSEQFGFVPNAFRVLACRADKCWAFFACHDALMEKEGGLSKSDDDLYELRDQGFSAGDIGGIGAIVAFLHDPIGWRV